MTDSMKRVSYQALTRVLESFGYSLRVFDGKVVFHHPGPGLLIALPELPGGTPVRPIDMLSVRNSLVNSGLIQNASEFDALFQIRRGDRLVWTDPQTRRATEVVAATGETSDGMVVITHNGATSICPVDQLARADGVAAVAAGR